jgi:hypothetical protein
MSIRLMSAAWELPLASTDKLVLLALADWSNDDGVCWPSIAQLCAKSGLSERAVRISIGRLRDDGHLERNETRGKGVTYTIHPRNAETPARRAPGKKCPRQIMPPAPDAETPARRAPNTPVTITPQIATQSSESVVSPPAAETDALKPEHVVEAWNEVASRLGLPVVKKLTSERMKRLRARIREHSVEDFTEAISAIERSPFLRGETGNRDWRADFDFFLQPTSFVKLIEGKYDGSGPH